MPAATGQRTTTASRKPNPRDYSGKQKAAAEAAVAEELAERQQEMALAAEAKVVAQDEPIDYTQGGYAAPAPEQPTIRREIHPDLAAEIEEAEAVEVGPREVTIRVNTKIEQMVLGRSVLDPGDPTRGIPPRLGHLQFYDFEEGQKYRVPVSIAEHLDELGYLWH